MQRRRVLWGLAVLAAGCTGASEKVPVTAPEPPAAVRESGDGDAGDRGSDELQSGVPDRTFDATEGGDLLVLLTVENRGERAREATVTVTVSAGEKAVTPTEHVVLDPTRRRISGSSFTFRTASSTPIQDSPSRSNEELATPLPKGTVTPYPEDRETATDGSTATDSPPAVADSTSIDDPTVSEQSGPESDLIGTE